MTKLDLVKTRLYPQAVNALTGAPLKNVFFELYKETYKVPEEGLSNDSGLGDFSVK